MISLICLQNIFTNMIEIIGLTVYHSDEIYRYRVITFVDNYENLFWDDYIAIIFLVKIMKINSYEKFSSKIYCIFIYYFKYFMNIIKFGLKIIFKNKYSLKI